MDIDKNKDINDMNKIMRYRYRWRYNYNTWL